MGDPVIEVPNGWDVHLADEPGVDLIVAESVDLHDTFRTNLVVTRVPVGGLDLRDWQKGTESINASQLRDYLVVDLELLVVARRPGGRRLAHHVSPENIALTMEQWFVVAEDVGHTLTFTVDTLRYDQLADLAAQVSTTFKPLSGDARAL